MSSAKNQRQKPTFFSPCEALPLISYTVGITITSVIILQFSYQYIFSSTTILRSILNFVIKYGTKLPIIRSHYNKEIAEITNDVKTYLPFKLKKDEHEAEIVKNYVTELNEKPLSMDQVVKDMSLIDESYNKDLTDAKCGNLQCYYYDQELLDLQYETYRKFMKTNMLHLDHYMAVRKFDAEVCRMVLGLYKGSNETAALHTSGGTESIFLGMLAYRNRFHQENALNDQKPQILMTKTAHPAFNRAANYFGMEIIYVKTDTSNFERMDVKDLKNKAKTAKRAVVLVLSCPNYPHGVFDPVKEIADLNLNIPIHLDCCLGGFLVPFTSDAGEIGAHVPICNFTVPGVQTISCDSHKYGCAPKGSSLILFNSEKLRSFALFTIATWSGGIYMSQTLSGSKSGASVAITWATMRKIGYNGYVEKTKKILKLTRKIYKFLSENKQIKKLGLGVFPAELSTITLYSEKFSIFKLLEFMNNKGWTMHALQEPSAIHICFTSFHTQKDDGDWIFEGFTKDIIAGLIELEAKGESAEENKTLKSLYGMNGALKDTDVVEGVIKEIFNAYYDTKE